MFKIKKTLGGYKSFFKTEYPYLMLTVSIELIVFTINIYPMVAQMPSQWQPIAYEFLFFIFSVSLLSLLGAGILVISLIISVLP